MGTGFIWPWSGWLGVRINVKEVEGVTVARVDYPEEDLKWEETTFLANGSVEIKLFCVPSVRLTFWWRYHLNIQNHFFLTLMCLFTCSHFVPLSCCDCLSVPLF